MKRNKDIAVQNWGNNPLSDKLLGTDLCIPIEDMNRSWSGGTAVIRKCSNKLNESKSQFCSFSRLSFQLEIFILHSIMHRLYTPLI